MGQVGVYVCVVVLCRLPLGKAEVILYFSGVCDHTTTLIGRASV